MNLTAAAALSRITSTGEDFRMLQATTNRVAAHTPTAINEGIRRRTEDSIAYLAEHPEEIDERLGELDREWDIERVIETNASALALTGVILGATTDRRFLIVPAVVTAFLLQHALQGWCPPVPILRRLGVRTASEIAEERYALKHLRGDFAEPVSASAAAATRAPDVLAAVRQ
jgi:hypothetical protein